MFPRVAFTAALFFVRVRMPVVLWVYPPPRCVRICIPCAGPISYADLIYLGGRTAVRKHWFALKAVRESGGRLIIFQGQLDSIQGKRPSFGTGGQLLGTRPIFRRNAIFSHQGMLIQRARM